MTRPKYRIIEENGLYYIEKRFLWFWNRLTKFGAYGDRAVAFYYFIHAEEALENYKKFKSFTPPPVIVEEYE